MLVGQVVNCGEKFDEYGCANKWEWISVNGSRIGLLCLFSRLIEFQSCSNTRKEETDRLQLLASAFFFCLFFFKLKIKTNSILKKKNVHKISACVEFKGDSRLPFSV